MLLSILWIVTQVVSVPGSDVAISEPIQINVPEPPYPPVVTVEATNPNAMEPIPGSRAPENPALYTLFRTGPTNHPLPVSYHLGGTAANGKDYLELTGEVVIPAGKSTEIVILQALADHEPEPSESVVLTIEPIVCPEIFPPPTECYVVGKPSAAVAVIHDTKKPINHRPRVEIAQPVAGDIFAPPATIPIIANAVDPDGWVSNVEFFANGKTIGEVHIAFLVEPPPGQSQVFEFEWTDVPKGAYLLRTRATDNMGATTWTESTPVIVREAPTSPMVNIIATDPYAREEALPDHPSNTARFRVRRTGPTNQPLTVDYQIDGTATHGEDYERIAGQVTIPAGRHTAVIHIVPIDDTIPEYIESVVLKLFVAVDVDPPPYMVGRRGKAGAVIVDRKYPAPLFGSIGKGIVYMCRDAQNGDILQVQVADQLDGEWEAVGTITVEDGAIHFVDPEAPYQKTRCYRFLSRSENSIAVDD